MLPNAQATTSIVGVFDLMSGTRLGRLDLRSPVVELAFAQGPSTVIAVTQV